MTTGGIYETGNECRRFSSRNLTSAEIRPFNDSVSRHRTGSLLSCLGGRYIRGFLSSYKYIHTCTLDTSIYIDNASQLSAVKIKPIDANFVNDEIS